MPAEVSIRDAVPADFPEILALNEEWEHFLSPASAARLEFLHAEAEYHRVVPRTAEDPGIDAFLLAFRENSRYDSPNYRWFVERYPAFLYVDRVVVSGRAQGRGLGSRLYDDLFAFAASTGVPRVVCEYDVEPMNEGSRRFHARYGFREVGRSTYSDPPKVVAMQKALVG